LTRGDLKFEAKEVGNLDQIQNALDDEIEVSK
jgi:hypothetical protein